MGEQILATAIGGLIVFLAGITVGYMGLPFKNAQKIAVLESRMKALEAKVGEMHRDLKLFIRDWRNGNNRKP